MDRSSVLRVLIFVFFLKLFNPVLTANDLTTTTATESQISDEVSAIPASISTPSTISVVPNNTVTTIIPSSSTKIPNTITPKKEIEAIMPEPPSTQLQLEGDHFALNFTAFENFVEFSVTVMINSSSKIGLIMASSKRLLLALENEHFNVDVISVPLTSDGSVNVFSNKIEDWNWNKRNGILLKDNVQNYKWISSNSKKNGSSISVIFQRNWQTCDAQDINFGLSMIKIWWLFDTDEKGPPKYENARMTKNILEKQIATENPVDNITTQPLNISVPLTTSTTIKGIATAASVEEVEVLKSIQESNFKGPVNFTFASLLRNVSFLLIKGCESTIQFRCNHSDVLQLQSANGSDEQQNLSIAKIVLRNNAFTQKVKTQPCSVAIDYANGRNAKKFHALLGFPNKNQGVSTTSWDYIIILMIILIIQVLGVDFDYESCARIIY